MTAVVLVGLVAAALALQAGEEVAPPQASPSQGSTQGSTQGPTQGPTQAPPSDAAPSDAAQSRVRLPGSLPPGSTSGSTSSGTAAAPAPDRRLRRAAAAGDALDALERAVAAGDRAAFTDVYGGSRAGRLYDTLTALPLSGWDLQLVATESRRESTWVGDVEARWSLAGFDERQVDVEVDVTFEQVRHGAATIITSIAPEESARTPEWLLGDTTVRQVRDALVISTRPALTDHVLAQTRRAIRDVRQVLPDFSDSVVVVVPEDAAQLEQVLGGRRKSYAEIAAVTTTIDGTIDDSAPVRVALNPAVYRDLEPLGGQVVLSHEITHAVTDAAISHAPLWLVEGFADYVALLGKPVPVDVAAAQILQQVRRSGPPTALPSSADFYSSAGGLGASYQAAWLACRLIASRYGEDSLIELYQRALEDDDIDAVMSDTLGTDVERFTRQWQTYLDQLA